jgi:hypothetical protein
VAVPTTSPEVLAAHDITTIIKASSDPNDSFKFPLTVIRSYERTADGAGLVMRFNLTNPSAVAIEIGGLGFAMPEAPGNPPKGIETTVWNDPHVGGDHGFVEFVRVVDDEKTLLVVPVAGSPSGLSDGASTTTTTTTTAPLEAWRPILEDLGGSPTWEWCVHSKAWAEDWAKSAQYVCSSLLSIAIFTGAHQQKTYHFLSGHCFG